jgi:hypothetical protein
MRQGVNTFMRLTTTSVTGHDFNPKYICLKCYIYPFTDKPREYITSVILLVSCTVNFEHGTN